MGILRSLLDVAFPVRCAACGTFGEGALCGACLEGMPWLLDPLCDRCGLPCRRRERACRRCRAAPPAFACARSAAAYLGPARQALVTFKLGGERRAAAALAEAMAGTAVGLEAPVVCFVPAARRALRERGFNPAEALAREVARRRRAPVMPLLAKVRETRDQAGLGRADRARNLAGAFRAAAPPGGAGFLPEAVLLVDDVMTTGATADACARALHAVGVRRVEVLTFARAL